MPRSTDMRMKFRTSKLIELCALRLASLDKAISKLEAEQEKQAWRKELRAELRKLADEVTETEITSDEISNRIYGLRSLARAEGYEYRIRDLKSERHQVNKFLDMLAATATVEHSVKANDDFVLTIVRNPKIETTEEV